MPVWLQDGNLAIDADSNVIECGNCPCGDPPVVSIPCCPAPLPATLTATVFSGAEDECASIDVSVPLTWDPDSPRAVGGSGAWTGEITVGGTPRTIRFYCNDDPPLVLRLDLEFDCLGNFDSVTGFGGCDPVVNIQFGAFSMDCNCDSIVAPNSVSIRITE